VAETRFLCLKVRFGAFLGPGPERAPKAMPRAAPGAVHERCHSHVRQRLVFMRCEKATRPPCNKRPSCRNERDLAALVRFGAFGIQTPDITLDLFAYCQSHLAGARQCENEEAQRAGGGGVECTQPMIELWRVGIRKRRDMLGLVSLFAQQGTCFHAGLQIDRAAKRRSVGESEIKPVEGFSRCFGLVCHIGFSKSLRTC